MSSPGGDNDESEGDDDLDVVSNPAAETGSASEDLRNSDSPGAHSNNGKLRITLCFVMNTKFQKAGEKRA